MLYFKRWTIEKAYNNSKSNLKETKAWSSDLNSLNNQKRLTAMIYNIMRVFEETSKIQNPELIHPSDKKYTKALEKRQAITKKIVALLIRYFFTKESSVSAHIQFRSFKMQLYPECLSLAL